MHLIAPDLLTHDSISRLLELISQAENIEGDVLHFDCSKLSFVDPLGLCVLHHWFQDLEQRGITVHLDGLMLDLESWLHRMDLFAGLSNLKYDNRCSGNARVDQRGNLLEIHSVSDINDVDKIAAKIAQTVVRDIEDISFDPDPDGMQPSAGERFVQLTEYVFSEILLNSLDHGRKRGFPTATAKVAAQYYSRRQRLQIAIVDNGCGLLETLKDHPKMEGEINDSKAIDIALLPKVSCNRDVDAGLDSKNQGIGLTVSSEIALRSGGKLGIFSGKGAVRKTNMGTFFKSEIPKWQGTGVFLELDRQNITAVDLRQIMANLPGYRVVPALNFG